MIETVEATPGTLARELSWAPEAIRLPVRVARMVSGPSEGELSPERESSALTISGIELAQRPAYGDARRVLVVSYANGEAPGRLGYTVAVRPGHWVGEHYHRRREERIILVSGTAEFRLLDQRPGLESFGEWNRFTVERAGLCIRVPARVAHTVIAGGQGAVLQVLASCDYEAADDIPVALSALGLGP